MSIEQAFLVSFFKSHSFFLPQRNIASFLAMTRTHRATKHVIARNEEMSLCGKKTFTPLIPHHYHSRSPRSSQRNLPSKIITTSTTTTGHRSNAQKTLLNHCVCCSITNICSAAAACVNCIPRIPAFSIFTCLIKCGSIVLPVSFFDR